MVQYYSQDHLLTHICSIDEEGRSECEEKSVKKLDQDEIGILKTEGREAGDLEKVDGQLLFTYHLTWIS